MHTPGGQPTGKQPTGQSDFNFTHWLLAQGTYLNTILFGRETNISNFNFQPSIQKMLTYCRATDCVVHRVGCVLELEERGRETIRMVTILSGQHLIC